jgi:hypothetical protein
MIGQRWMWISCYIFFYDTFMSYFWSIYACGIHIKYLLCFKICTAYLKVIYNLEQLHIYLEYCSHSINSINSVFSEILDAHTFFF